MTRLKEFEKELDSALSDFEKAVSKVATYRAVYGGNDIKLLDTIHAAEDKRRAAKEALRVVVMKQAVGA